MKKNNIIQEKSFAFALRSVNVYKYLTQEKKEFVMSKQFLRCSTSIGANIEESIGAQSDADFFSKISISYKEARESRVWIKLLEGSDYLNKTESQSLLSDIDEILKIIGTIQKTIKSRNSKKISS